MAGRLRQCRNCRGCGSYGSKAVVVVWWLWQLQFCRCHRCRSCGIAVVALAMFRLVGFCEVYGDSILGQTRYRCPVKDKFLRRDYSFRGFPGVGSWQECGEYIFFIVNSILLIRKNAFSNLKRCDYV